MILLNVNIYTTLCILLQFLVEVKSQTTTFKPALRGAHTATFINNKLYILNGLIPFTLDPVNESFFCLDFSAPFNTSELKWINLSSNNIVPPSGFAAAFKSGEKNNTLFVYGGQSINETMALVYTFDTKNNLWSIPNITGKPPPQKDSVVPIIDQNGLIYLFGGIISETFNSGIYTNSMVVLDSINLSWKKVSSINAPSARAQYGAVFLPQSKSIIYMGGFREDVGAFPLNEVYLYDTVNNVWTTKTTNGLIPSVRYGFTTVLGLDEQRVIVFGGFGFDNNATDKQPANSLYVLGLNDFNWYTPRLPGKIPSNRAFHKTVLIGKYMVVAFGLGYTQENDSDILLLDISDNDKYIWTTSFEPLPPSPTVPSSTINTVIIIGSVIGSLIGIILLLIGGFFICKCRNSSASTREILRLPKKIADYNQQAIDFL